MLDPCLIELSYSLKKQPMESEETVKISASPVVIALSVETTITILKLISSIMSGEEVSMVQLALLSGWHYITSCVIYIAA